MTENERHGSKEFYHLLDEMSELHDKKSHDYASNENPYGNYHFAGVVANLFAHSSEDAGFVGRIAEKIYRLANLEKSGKIPNNESVEDTERDICVITVLWMASRRERRRRKGGKFNYEIKDMMMLMPDTQLMEILRFGYDLIESRKLRA